jgi:hypothetical protein
LDGLAGPRTHFQNAAPGRMEAMPPLDLPVLLGGSGGRRRDEHLGRHCGLAAFPDCAPVNVLGLFILPELPLLPDRRSRRRPTVFPMFISQMNKSARRAPRAGRVGANRCCEKAIVCPDTRFKNQPQDAFHHPGSHSRGGRHLCGVCDRYADASEKRPAAGRSSPPKN